MNRKKVCALFRREDRGWKLIRQGTLQNYPRIGENIIVAYSKQEFTYTQPIVEVVEVLEEDPNELVIVFQDSEAMWKLNLPAHSNDINKIKEILEMK